MLVKRRKQPKSFIRGYEYVSKTLKNRYKDERELFITQLAAALDQSSTIGIYRFINGTYAITQAEEDKLREIFTAYGCANPFDIDDLD